MHEEAAVAAPRSKPRSGLVYLDHAATTPLAPEVLEVMLPFMRETYGNPSGLHEVSRQAACALKNAREETAQRLGAGSEQIVFTSGGTESNNLGIFGSLSGTGHILVGAIEHASALYPALQLRERGFEVEQLPCDCDGLYSPTTLKSLLRADTVLIVLGLANSELGVVQDIAALSGVSRVAGRAHFHCDAVGAGGKLKIQVDSLGVDSLSLSAHKFYGPKGSGLLYLRHPERSQPILWGGGQEQGLRSGTQNVAGAMGLTAALALCERERETEAQRLPALREALWNGLRQRCPQLRRQGRPEHSLPGLLSVIVPDHNGESLALEMSYRGVAVSSGSACSALHSGPSHVLLALGLGNREIHGHLRFALGRSNRTEEVEPTLQAFGEALRLQSEKTDVL